MEAPSQHHDDKLIAELERQLERSGFFTHSSLSLQAERINEIESFLYGVIDSLLERGVLEKQDFEACVKRVRDETLKRKEHFHAGVAIRMDNAGEGNFTPVNCDERLPICKAVCCKLNFALSVEEIESRKVKWDLGQPYFIRQRTTGYCTHLDANKTCCSVYADRPKVCRKYSCAHDKRIWKDFEQMELNTEWIEAHLKEQQVRLAGLFMVPEEKIEYTSKPAEL